LWKPLTLHVKLLLEMDIDMVNIYRSTWENVASLQCPYIECCEQPFKHSGTVLIWRCQRTVLLLHARRLSGDLYKITSWELHLKSLVIISKSLLGLIEQHCFDIKQLHTWSNDHFHGVSVNLKMNRNYFIKTLHSPSPHGATHPPCGQGLPHYWGFTIILRHTTLGRTHLGEGSTRPDKNLTLRRDRYPYIQWDWNPQSQQASDRRPTP